MNEAEFHYEITLTESGGLSYVLQSDDVAFIQSLISKWQPRFAPVAQNETGAPLPYFEHAEPFGEAPGTAVAGITRETALLQQIQQLQSQLDTLANQALEKETTNVLDTVTAAPTPADSSFEHPVDKTLNIVDNFALQQTLQAPQTPVNTNETPFVTPFEQPVDNFDLSVSMVSETASQGPVTMDQNSIASAVPDSSDDDLDKLLDTVKADLASEPFLDPADMPIATTENALNTEPELFAFSQAPLLEDSPHSDSVDPFEAGLAQIEADMPSPPATVNPSASAGPEQAQPTAPKPSGFNPMQAMTEINARSLKDPVYAPPKVDYDFGIPAIESNYNMDLRTLSLEALQTPEQLEQADEMTSVFPEEAELNTSGPLFSSFSTKVTRFKMGQAASREEVSTAGPAPDMQIPEFETLQELCDLAPNANLGEDFLILAAFFLDHAKQTPVYSLKDINAQLVRAGLTPVHHGILENVINAHLLAVEQDMTGTAKASEYRLTGAGYDHLEALMEAPTNDMEAQDVEA